MALHFDPALSLPPWASNFDPVRTEQAFAASFCSSPILDHLAMISDQPSVLFLLQSGDRHHTEGFVLTPQITIQRVTQLRAVSLIGLLPLGFSTPHRLGRHHQVADSQCHQFAM